MRILFIHQNFPGQWLHIAHHLRGRAEDIVIAIADYAHRRTHAIDTYYYRMPSVDLNGMPQPVSRFALNYARGQAVARVMLKLRSEGFTPDVVAGHAGWGETLFVKEVWPDTRLVIYGEFFYRTCGFDVDFDAEFSQADPLARISVAANNATMATAATSADVILTPTLWQRNSFPEILRSKMTVLHEGVATEVMRREPSAHVEFGRDGNRLSAADQVITFVARNLEPYRGFHVFMRSLPEIMRRLKDAHIIIIGGDQVSYGMPPPGGQTWKAKLLEEVGERLDMTRIHFVGQVPHAILLQCFSISTCHVYLTYPFVLSWSMLEAMSMECLVVGSRTGPVTEVIEHGRNGLLVDFFDQAALAAQIVEAVENRTAFETMRTAARETIVKDFDLRTKCLPDALRLLGADRPQAS